MQLTLSPPQRLRRVPARPVPLRSLAVPWRDSASAQLDALAAAERGRATRGGQWLWLAVAGVAFVVLLAMTWRAPPAQPRDRALVVQGPVGVMPVGPLARSSTPVEPATELLRGATAAPAARLTTLPLPQDKRALPSADSGPRKAPVPSARQQAADAAVRPMRPHVEPAQAEVELGDPAHTSPVGGTPLVSPGAPLAQDVLRSVREVCAGTGGFLGEQFCRSRECRKSEHQADPVCVRLRDVDEARLRSAAER